MRTARIDRWNDRATVVHDPAAVGVDAMVAAVTEAGFEASVGSVESESAAATGGRPVDAPGHDHGHDPEDDHGHDPEDGHGHGPEHGPGHDP